MNSDESRLQKWCENPAANIQSVCSVGGCRKRKGPLTTRAGGCSEIGNVRQSNDDLVFASNDCRLCVVLDGVGGYAGGGEASLIVLEKLRSNIEAMCERNFDEASHGLETGVRKALKAATNSMLELANQQPDLEKMSTVFALAYVIDGMLLYTHVGDCRVYLIRSGEARQLTQDETFVQLLVDSATIKPEDIPSHPMKNVVLNAVGTRSVQYDPVVHSVMLLPGDTVVLTSDGVTDVLSNSRLVQADCGSDNPESRAASIVQAALDAGSRDNVSCVVVAIERAEEPDDNGRNELHFELARLHDLLANVDSVDGELRDEMRQVADDLRLALKQSQSNDVGDLSQKLQERALRLEAKHPRLVSLVSSIANLLSGMGI